MGTRFKKFASMLMMMVLLFNTPFPGGDLKVRAVSTTYYVATNGNDSWNGESAAFVSGSNGPFATINRAKTVIRAQIAGGMTSDITVLIRGGEYDHNATLVFDERDSGRDGFEVNYKNYPGEEPVINGGSPLTGWQQHSGSIYKTNVGAGWEFNTLTENGVSSVKARYPNTGYSRTAEAVPGSANIKSKFKFTQGDIPVFSSLTDVVFHIWPGGPSGEANWAQNLIAATSIDYPNRQVNLGGNATYEIGSGSRYFVTGALELLDQPGEFYLNSATGDLYYWPVSTGDIAQQDIQAPKISRIIDFVSTGTGKTVEHITLDGLEITNSDAGNSSSDVNSHPAVKMQRAAYITIKNSILHNLGNSAIEMKFDAKHNEIYGNKFYDVGFNGIKVMADELTVTNEVNFNSIINNDISKIGRLIGHGVGVSISQSSDNTIQHNRIYDCPRFGISIGNPTPPSLVGRTVGGVTVTYSNVKDYIYTQRNVIQYNDVFDCMKDSQDGGLIYTYGVNAGSLTNGNTIDSNAVHDSNINMSYGFALYLDDNSDGTAVTNNLSYNMQTIGNSGPGVLQGQVVLKGQGSKFNNNYLINGVTTKGAVYSINSIPSTAYTDWLAKDQEVNNNIFYNVSALDGSVYAGSSWQEGRFKSANLNTIYNNNGLYGVNFADLATKSFTEWKTLYNNKYDNYSRLADPQFVDIANEDFRLMYNSPVHALGTEAIDFEKIGLKADFQLADTGALLDKLYIKTATTHSGEATIKLAPSATSQLTVSGRTTSGAFIPDLSTGGSTATYGASNITGTNVASVNSSGLVTALNTGIAKITATVDRGAETETIDIYVVVNDAISTLTLKSANLVLYTGALQQLQVEGESDLGLDLYLTESVNYSSSAAGVATVDANGVLTAVAPGTSTITATAVSDPTKTDDITVTVISPGSYLKSLTITLVEQVLDVSETTNVEVTGISYADTAINFSGATITYAMDTGGIAAVNNNNQPSTTLEATGEGRGVLTATVVLNGVTKTASVKVISYASTTSDVPLPWQVVNYGIGIGKFTVGFAKYDAVAADFRLAGNGENIWGMSDSATYMYQNVIHDKGTTSLSISARVKSLDNVHASAAAGVMIRDANTANSKQVDFRIEPSGSAVFVYRTADGGASGYSAGYFPGFNGELKLTRMGDVFIGYYKPAGSSEWQEAAHVTIPMDNQVTAGVLAFSHADLTTEARVDNIAITTGPVVLYAASVTTDKNYLAVGTTAQAVVKGYSNPYNSEMSLAGATITYASSNASVATVDSSGVISFVAVGTADITATVTLNGVVKAATKTITVENWQMVGASLSDTPTDIALSGTKQAVVKALLPDGSSDTLPGTATITYDSSNTSVATVNSSGLITGVAYGVATIHAVVINSGITYNTSVMVVVNSGKLYSEGWENGMDSKWKMVGVPEISSTRKRGGSNSIFISSSNNRIYDDTTISSIDGIQEFWFFDDGTTPKNAYIISDWIGAGLANHYSSTKYYSRNLITSSTIELSTATRSKGWHQVIFDYMANAGELDVYMDGVLINHLNSVNPHTTIGMGDHFGNGTSVNTYFDDISIYSTSTPSSIPVTGVTLNKSATNMIVGQTEALVETLLPANATNQSVSWSSSNTDAVTVDQSGVITAVGVGNTVITVTTADGSFTAICNVAVTQAVTNLLLNNGFESGTQGWQTLNNYAVNGDQPRTGTQSLKLLPGAAGGEQYINSGFAAGDAFVASAWGMNDVSGGSNAALTVSCYDVNWTRILNDKVFFTPTSTSFEQKSINFVIPAGTTRMFVILNRTTGTGNFYADDVSLVKTSAPVAVTGVTLNKSTTSIVVGQTETLTATVSPANAANKNVTWSSNNTAAATVNQAGIITAMGGGSAVVTVTTVDGSFTDTVDVTVTQAFTNLLINSGFENGTQSWSTLNNYEINADQPRAGAMSLKLLSGAAGGEQFIGSGFTAGDSFTVSAWGMNDLSGGSNAALTVSCYDASWSRILNEKAFFTTTATSYEQKSISFTVPAGTTRMFVILKRTTGAGNFYADDVALVKTSSVVPATSVALNKSATTIVAGHTEILTATVSPANATNQNVTWSSSDTAVATVNQTGTVTAVSAGNAAITVTTADGNFTATTNVTVAPTGVNLLTNNGFENGTQGWQTLNNYAVNGEQPRTGTKSLKLLAGAAGGEQYVNSGFAAGDTFTASAWGRNDISGGSNAVLTVSCYDAGWTRILNDKAFFTTTATSYEQKSLSFIVPAGTTRIFVILKRTTGAGNFYADDVTLIKQ